MNIWGFLFSFHRQQYRTWNQPWVRRFSLSFPNTWWFPNTSPLWASVSSTVKADYCTKSPRILLAPKFHILSTTEGKTLWTFLYCRFLRREVIHYLNEIILPNGLRDDISMNPFKIFVLESFFFFNLISNSLKIKPKH